MNYSVNILAFIIGGFFNMLLGALWYSNLLFAKSWMKEAGINREDVGDSSGICSDPIINLLYKLLNRFYYC